MTDTAVEPAADQTVTPGRWHAVLIPLDTRSTDLREFASAGFGNRDLPLPLMLLTETSWGHDGAVIAGSIESMTVEGGNVVATGTYADIEDGALAEQLVRDQIIRWVSVDAEVMAYELIIVGADGSEVVVENEGDFYDMEMEDQVIYRATEWNIIGATICPFPAFPQAVIAPEDVDLPAAATQGAQAATALGMTKASRSTITASAFPERPPADWFADPQLDGPTPFTVTEEGRVFGHLATWGTCHIGIEGVCLTAPRSETAYAYARTGEVVCADGSCVAVAQLTMDTGHAPRDASARAAAEHYDDCRCGAVDFAVGEDDHGIWMAGAVRPDVDEIRLRRLRASAVSGDWRRIGGNLELVAALAVNVPGFPIPRASAYVASGQQQSLVAAGVVMRDTAASAVAQLRGEFGERLARIERSLSALSPQVAAAFRAEVHRS